MFALCSILVAQVTLADVPEKAVATAQPELTTEQMVEQLKPPAATRSLRSMRNLSVGKSDELPASQASTMAVPAVPAGSLSLAIQFDFNSARVTSSSSLALKRLAAAMKSDALSLARFRVEGHTDAKGSAEYNLKLSNQRAEAVKAFLAGEGVSSARMDAIGKGFSELVNAAHPEADENRRVRIVNLN